MRERRSRHSQSPKSWHIHLFYHFIGIAIHVGATLIAHIISMIADEDNPI